MPQQQPDRSGEPPLGRCTVCGEAVTRDDPGRMTFVQSSGQMTNVHTRCESGEAAEPPAQ